MDFIDFDDIISDVFHSPNDYTHDNAILEEVFDNTQDLPEYDKIATHLGKDYMSFFDGKVNYDLSFFISRLIIDHAWEPPQNIWFWCCFAGRVHLTQQLSNITGACIKAPDGYLIVQPNVGYFVSDSPAEEMQELYYGSEKDSEEEKARKLDQFWEIAEDDAQIDKWIDLVPDVELSNMENDIMYESVLAILREKQYDTEYDVRDLDDWWNLINEGDEDILNDPSSHPSVNLYSRRKLWQSLQL